MSTSPDHQESPGDSPTDPGTSSQGYPITQQIEDATPPEPSFVSYTPPGSYSKRSVKARIDRNVPLEEIIRQLCTSVQLGVQEPPALFALRDADTDELITQDNLLRKLEMCSSFKLVSSPLIEAVEICEKLGQRDDDAAVKKATFQLKTFAKEPDFVNEFFHRGGLHDLVRVIRTSKSNTLAYALASLESLIELDEGWESLDESAISCVINILVTQNLANICRPATSIVRRLIAAPSPDSKNASSSDSPKAFIFGFDAVWLHIKKEPKFFSTLAQRLSGGDYLLIQSTLGLITTLMSHVTEKYYDELTEAMEESEISRTVISMIDSHRGDDLESLILQYQSHIVSFYHHQKCTPVDLRKQSHFSLLESVCAASKVDITSENAYEELGFLNFSPQTDFDKVGLLGLKAMRWFSRNPEFPKMMLEIVSRPTERRCPFAQVCNETTEILSDIFEFNSGVATATSFQPFMLAFPRVHKMVLNFYIRIWTESSATVVDFPRVSSLVRSCVQSALRNESTRSWAEVEREFQETEYSLARERQIKELAIEDDLLSKAPVRSLRGRVLQESYEFVRAQRVNCLQEGAWFQQAASQFDPSRKVIQRVWRFYRLAANRKHLHYSAEYSQKVVLRGGLDDLPEKIDINTITDVIAINQADRRGSKRSKGLLSVGTNHHNSLVHPTSPGGQHGANVYNNNGTISDANSMSFGIFNAQGLVAELISQDAALYSEWLDGLSLLRPDGYVATPSTSDIIHALTEIQVKVKLLDLSGERIEIPSYRAAAPVPTSCDFYYADL